MYLRKIVGLFPDGSRFKAASKTLCTGVLARDSNGLVMGACVHINNCVPIASAAEALACVRALQFARDMGFQRVLLKGDSKTVIEKLMHEDVDRSCVNANITDAKNEKFPY